MCAITCSTPFANRRIISIRHDTAGSEEAHDGSRRPKAGRPRERLASLKVSGAFKSFVLAQLEELGEVLPRSMFGGVGLYRRGVFFAIMARDTLFMKVDDRNRRDYVRAKMKPFKPYRIAPGRWSISQCRSAFWRARTIWPPGRTRRSPSHRLLLQSHRSCDILRRSTCDASAR